MAEIIKFRDPSVALEGLDSLPVRRRYRAKCNAIAEGVVAQAFSDSGKGSDVKDIGVSDALPIFVGAMRRELRKVWPGL